MAMPKGDPRARAFGRKGGQASAAARKRRKASDPPTVEPRPLEANQLPLDNDRQNLLVERLRQNARTFTQIAEAVDEKVILGVIVRIIMTESQAASVRIQAAQTWLKHHGGDPVDTTAIASAIVTLEGDLIDLDEFKTGAQSDATN